MGKFRDSKPVRRQRGGLSCHRRTRPCVRNFRSGPPTAARRFADAAGAERKARPVSIDRPLVRRERGQLPRASARRQAAIDDLGGEAAANQKQFNETAAEVGKNAVEVTRSAVDAVAKLPTARPMNGRERCAVAPNGAPDCVAAAETLCRRHGFSTGKSIEFTSAEECPPKAVLAAQPERAECTTVTFISKAMCQ
jgi:hypothetical protein